MTEPIPEARLAIECFMTNPPRAAGIHVQVEDKILAILSIEEFKKAARSLAQLEAKYRRETMTPSQIAAFAAGIEQQFGKVEADRFRADKKPQEKNS